MEDEALHILYLNAYISGAAKESPNVLLPMAAAGAKTRQTLAVIAIALSDARADRPRSVESLRAELRRTLRGPEENASANEKP